MRACGRRRVDHVDPVHRGTGRHRRRLTPLTTRHVRAACSTRDWFVTKFCAGVDQHGDDYLEVYYPGGDPARDWGELYEGRAEIVLATFEYCSEGQITIDPPFQWTYPDLDDSPVTINEWGDPTVGEGWFTYEIIDGEWMRIPVEWWPGQEFSPDGVPVPVAELDRVLASQGCAALQGWQRAYRNERVDFGEGPPVLLTGRREAWLPMPPEYHSVFAHYALDIGRQAECDWATPTP